MRQANAIDFWRGLALVMIFIDHVPGNIFMRLTIHNYALSDAAELFVFLSGWTLSIATGGPAKPDLPSAVVLRLASRTVEVYRAQLVTTALALAILAFVALWEQNPLFLEWHNAAPVFFNPVPTTIGWVLMTHQLGYFNILPLYVVLLAMAPAFVILARKNAALACVVSVAIYFAAQIFRLNFHTWPYAGFWFFNPFAWQILFALGFLAGELAQSSERFARLMRAAAPWAMAVALIGAAVTISGYRPDPMRVPQPATLFLFDKSFLSPARLINFLALVIALQGLYGLIAPHARWLNESLSALGRNSLAVFTVGSLASLIGQIARFLAGGTIVMDVAIVVFGFSILIFTSWFVEWRTRFRGLSQPSFS